MTAGTRRGESRTLRPINPASAAAAPAAMPSRSIQWMEDHFDSIDGGEGFFLTTYLPLLYGEDIEVNGVRVPRGAAWTRAEDSKNVVIVDPALFFPGPGPWWVSVHYPWISDVPVEGG